MTPNYSRIPMRESMPAAAVSTSHKSLPFVGCKQLRRQLLRLVRSFQDRFQRRRLVRAGHHEHDQRRVVRHRSRHRDALGVKLAHPVAHHQASIIVQRLGSREERKCMALVAHADQEKIEARKLRRRASLNDGAQDPARIPARLFRRPGYSALMR